MNFALAYQWMWFLCACLGIVLIALILILFIVSMLWGIWDAAHKKSQVRDILKEFGIAFKEEML